MQENVEQNTVSLIEHFRLTCITNNGWRTTENQPRYFTELYSLVDGGKNTFHGSNDNGRQQHQQQTFYIVRTFTEIVGWRMQHKPHWEWSVQHYSRKQRRDNMLLTGCMVPQTSSHTIRMKTYTYKEWTGFVSLDKLKSHAPSFLSACKYCDNGMRL